MLYRIRDLMVIIAVEAMCLAQIVSPESEDEMDNRFGATLLHSRDRIHAVHQFLMEQSEDLEGDHSEDLVFPAWPMPVLCLAWSIVLRSLPANLQPPSGDYFQLDTGEIEDGEPEIYIAVANRALRLSSGLFPWLEVILQGPLFEGAKDAFSGDLAVDMAALRRSPLKGKLTVSSRQLTPDLLIGLSEMIHVDAILDRDGLYRSWDLLFGGGSPETSTSLTTNYWNVDFVYDDRRAILDQARFPRDPMHLPGLLAALTGVSSEEELDLAEIATDTVPEVYEYLNNLPSITIVAPPATFTGIGFENGKLIVEAGVDYELPGGAVIPRRTRGIVISTQRDTETVVTWRFHQPSLSLVVEILRVAAGLLPRKHTVEGARKMTLEDLGIQGELPKILAVGLKLIRCVLRSPHIARRVVDESSSSGDEFRGKALLDLALAVVSSRADISAAKYAIDILESLLLTGDDNIWAAFRASGFFDSHTRRQASVATLIQSDAKRGHQGLTIAVLRLVRSLASANAGDPHVVRAAVKLVMSEIWTQFSAWRYRDVSKRYEIAAILLAIFDGVLRHPVGADGKSPTPAAAYLIEAFITGASPLTYKPMVDVFTQSTQVGTKMIQSRRWTEAAAIFETYDHAASLLANLVRIAPSLKIAGSALPYSVFASTVVLHGGDKIQLVDHLFELITQPFLGSNSVRLTLRLLRVYLETTAQDAQRPSLAGMLRSTDKTCTGLAELAFSSAVGDVKPEAWSLLSVVLATQPGCASFCVGQPKDGKVEGPLKMAVEEVLNWKQLLREGPRALAAVLGYCQSASQSPSGIKGVSALRNNGEFWQAVHDVAIKNIPRPSSLSDTLVEDVADYSYSVQAKANATAFIATELALIIEEDGPETKAQSLTLSLFRNSEALQDVATAAIRTSCDPALHAGEAAALEANGIEIVCLRTIQLPNERIFGANYLYDGIPEIYDDPERHAAVARSLAFLNLNWSQLDADIGLTKAFRLLTDVTLTWTEGDSLAAKATLRAAIAVANEISNEDQGGDVMLAIQTERLNVLAALLDTALDPEMDPPTNAAAKDLAESVRKIVESQLFPPLISLRHPELAPIHRPVLRILCLICQAKVANAADEVRGVLFDAGARVALDAADIVLDYIMRDAQPGAGEDLALIVNFLCELSRIEDNVHIWVDYLQYVNLIPRSLQVLVASTSVNVTLPAHFHTILLLHLAIAANPVTAEKLVVNGVMPAYSDNIVAVAAEQGNIQPDASEGSMHRAWCGMLLVVTALLTSLSKTASFARADVHPWVRLVLPQLLNALDWDGESILSNPALEELVLAADIFYGMSCACAEVSVGQVGNPGAELLRTISPSDISLIKGINEALSHPHRFVALIVPSDDEERIALEKEAAKLETVANIDLLASSTPVIASRTAQLIAAARATLLSLVQLTRAWELLEGADPRPDQLIPFDDEHLLSAADDPLGAITTLLGYLLQLKSPAATQAAEAAALLSLTQLAARAVLAPVDENSGSRAGAVREQLAADLIASLKPKAEPTFQALLRIAEAEFEKNEES